MKKDAEEKLYREMSLLIYKLEPREDVPCPPDEQQREQAKKIDEKMSELAEGKIDLDSK